MRTTITAKITTAVQNPRPGLYVSVDRRLSRKISRKIYGFTVGGALIKDKLFWMYTFDQHSPHLPGNRGSDRLARFLLAARMRRLPAASLCNTAHTAMLYGQHTNALDQPGLHRWRRVRA